MTKDFEVLALERSDEHRKGLRPFQMYDSNDMNAAFLAGAKYGREAGLELAAGIISTELQDLEEAEFMERDKERINIRAWLMNARACIRAAKEKKGTSE